MTTASAASRIILLAVSLITAFQAFAAATSRRETVQLQYNPADLILERLPTGANVFYRVTLRGAAFTTEQVGQPELPQDRFTIVLPPDASNVAVETVDACSSSVITGITVMLREPDAITQLSGIAGPKIVEGTRIRPSRPPSPCTTVTNATGIVQLIGTTVRYGARVAVFGIAPLAYAPEKGELSLHMHLHVSVTYSSSASAGALYRDLAAAQREELRREVMNKSVLDEVAASSLSTTSSVTISSPDSFFVVHSTEPAKQESIPYVLITTQPLATSFQPLIDWRTATGDTARIVTMDWIAQHYAGVDPANRVRNFIADALGRWSTSWVLLGGDTDQVPHRYGLFDSYVNVFGPTDLYFSGQNGNWNADGNAVFGEPSDNADIDPDLFIGRAPVTNALQATNFVKKVLTYETTPPQYIDSALLMGVKELGSDSFEQNSIVPLLPTSYQVVRLYDSQSQVPATATLNNANANSFIDQAFHVVNHMDHSGIDGMGTGANEGGGGLSEADADAFTNSFKPSIVWTYGCDPNAFDYASISENWMNNPQGGAVAFVGNTRSGYAGQTSQDARFFQAWFVDGVRRIGALLAKTQGTSFDDYYSRSMNLLGDPAMPVWIHQPPALTVTGPGALRTGTNSATVTVGNLPSGQEATVTFEKASDNVLVTRQTLSGTVTEPLALHTAGTLLVTVRAAERLPWQGTVTVSPASGSHVYVADVQIDDAANGNNNQRLEAGEQAIVHIKLGNGGAATSPGIAATLTAITPGVTTSTAAAGVFPIAYGSFATIDFSLAVANSFADGEAISVDLTAGAKTRIIIPIFAPHLEQTHTYSDSAGNLNVVPSPNKNIEFKLHVINNGFGDAKGVTATLALTTTSGAITLVTPNVTVGDVAAKSAADSVDAFKLKLSSTFAPATDVVMLSMTDSLGNVTTQPIHLSVPATPTGLTTRGTAHDIKAIWNPASDPLARNYRIYRGPVSGPYSSIETFLLRDASFYDDITAIGGSPVYDYGVTAVDQFGNESAATIKTAFPSLDPHPGFPRSVLPADGSISGHIATSDVDNDGKKEIFALTSQSQNGPGALYAWKADGSQLINFGNPNFAEFASLDGGGVGVPAFADIDGDQKIDIVVNGRYKIYAFHAGGLSVAGWENGVGIPPISCGGVPTVGYTSPVIADLNGDGHKEIITTAIDGGEYCDGGNAHLYVFNGSGALLKRYDFPKANYSFGTPAVADLNGDGKQEVIFANSRDLGGNDHEGDIFILNGSVPSGSVLTPIVAVPHAVFSNEVSLGDLDGDGNLDLVVASSSDQRVYAFHAVKTQVQEAGTPVNGWQGGVPLDAGDKMVNNFSLSTSIALGDLDCDDKVEVVAVSESKVYIFDNNGTRKPGWPVVRDGRPGPSTSQASPLIASVDPNGHLDIVVASANTSGEGTLEAWDAETALPVSHFPVVIDDPFFRTPAVADLLGNGGAELIAGAGSKLYVWDTAAFTSPGIVVWPQIFRDQVHTSTQVKREYVVKDPKLCSIVRIGCPPDADIFSDACGCGCMPKVP